MVIEFKRTPKQLGDAIADANAQALAANALVNAYVPRLIAAIESRGYSAAAQLQPTTSTAFVALDVYQVTIAEFPHYGGRQVDSDETRTWEPAALAAQMISDAQFDESQWAYYNSQPKTSTPTSTSPPSTATAPMHTAPSVNFENLSGNAGLLYVGDTWSITATGPAGAAVSYRGGKNGARDNVAVGHIGPDGTFSLTGQPGAGDIGAWAQDWYVGSSRAATIQFTVAARPATTVPPIIPSAPGVTSMPPAPNTPEPNTAQPSAIDTVIQSALEFIGAPTSATKRQNNATTPTTPAAATSLFDRAKQLPVWVWFAAAAGAYMLTRRRAGR